MCASACPTSAITYAYPPPDGQLAALRAALVAYREAGGQTPAILFHDSQTGADEWERVARQVPESVIPWAVEEIGSVGMDAWVACIAWGARAVMLVPPQVPGSVRRELDVQIEVTRAILDSMGYAPALLTLVADDEALDHTFGTEPEPVADPPATFAPSGEKRTDIRLALDHLHAHARRRPEVVELPPAAPFGKVRSRSRCLHPVHGMRFGLSCIGPASGGRRTPPLVHRDELRAVRTVRTGVPRIVHHPQSSLPLRP